MRACASDNSLDGSLVCTAIYLAMLIGRPPRPYWGRTTLQTFALDFTHPHRKDTFVQVTVTPPFGGKWRQLEGR